MMEKAPTHFPNPRCAVSNDVMLVAYKVLSALTVLAGAGGMGLSFLSMACADLPNTVAGAAGFVAGSVLVGAGLVALALFSLVPARDPAPAQDALFRGEK